MLSIKSISKAYAGRTLFSDVSIQINRRDRIGVVGPNGAGKSTLFSVISKVAYVALLWLAEKVLA